MKQSLLYPYQADLNNILLKQKLDFSLPSSHVQHRPKMHSSLLTILVPLLLPTMAALPTPVPAASNAKRCLTEAQIEALRAQWPKLAGHGPVINPCDKTNSSNTSQDTTTALPEVQKLARP